MATVHIVEDLPESREFLATLLRYHNHLVVEAADALEGLSIASTAPPDLIIADVVMPTIDGYEFVRRLRMNAATANTPIIFWTAYFNDQGTAGALAEYLGVACVLPKSSEHQAIFAAVNRALANSGGSAGLSALNEFDTSHRLLLTDKVFDLTRELETSRNRLRASEGQYRALFEGNPFPMWILDASSLKFFAVNDAAIGHYGYSRREFLEMSFRELCVPEEYGMAPGTERSTMRHCLKNGGEIDVVVFRWETEFDGQRTQLELIEDVTEQNRADKKIRESEAQLHRLAEHLRFAQEEERTRIARNLHDHLGQQLTAVRMALDWILRRIPGSPASGKEGEIQSKLLSSRDLVDEATTAVQRIATELRPGVLDYGIGAAIEGLVREFQSRSEIACTVDVPDHEEPLDPALATETYRIFQEVLTNVARHSGATRLDVDLRRVPSGLVLEVHDNGKGITQAQISSRESIGLLGMRERAAMIGSELSIQGSPESGTTVRLEVPLAGTTP